MKILSNKSYRELQRDVYYAQQHQKDSDKRNDSLYKENKLLQEKLTRAQTAGFLDEGSWKLKVVKLKDKMTTPIKNKTDRYTLLQVVKEEDGSMSFYYEVIVWEDDTEPPIETTTTETVSSGR